MNTEELSVSRSRDGLSRRDLIRGAAAAGAAAWTAPIIVGSIASPAAAGTPACNKFYVKLSVDVSFHNRGSSSNQDQQNDEWELDSYGCYDAAPSCDYVLASGINGVCYNPSGSNNDFPCKTLPTVTDLGAASNGEHNYLRIDLPTGDLFTKSTFDAESDANARWLVVANYNFNCIKVPGVATGTAAPLAGGNTVGQYIINGNQAWVRKFWDWDSGATQDNTNEYQDVALSYVYLQFCADKKPKC